tara:strand:+ start:3035 stop:3796 length:762 start_codon:yes stop_codon:yes gene_type:complete
MISHDLIITTFNSYSYLESLYLLISKNINNYSRIFIIDDCSNEKFFKLLKYKFKNLSINIFRNEKNLGPSSSRNIGINLSNADYISFHDPDDMIHDQRFYVINYFLKKFRPNIIFHDFSEKNLKNEIIGNFKYKFHNGYFYLFKSLYVTPAFTCRRDFLIAVGGYKENLRYAEDLDLYIRLREKSKFLFVNHKLVKISSKKERLSNLNHLSSNIKLMRSSINTILLDKIFPLNIFSIVFVFALLINKLKSFIE